MLVSPSVSAKMRTTTASVTFRRPASLAAIRNQLGDRATSGRNLAHVAPILDLEPGNCQSSVMSYGIDKLTGIPVRAISSFSKAPGQDVQCEGWLLKKRRRKHQGFATRYFVLRASGVLSYSLHPQLTPREQLNLHTATISSSSSRRDIHIDCDSGTYHVKATSAGDFEMWMTAFRKFIHVAVEGGTLSRRFSLVRSPNLSSGPQIHDIGATLDQMGLAINTLEDVVMSLKNSEQNKRAAGHPKFKKDSGKDREGLRYMFRKSSTDTSSTLQDSSDLPPLSDASPFHHLQDTVRVLKAQLDRLRTSLVHVGDSMSAESPVEPPTSPLLTSDQYNHLRRGSVATFRTSNTSTQSIWYDAVDGPEEFVIMDDITPTSELSEAELTSSSESVEAMVTVDTAEDETGDEESDSDRTHQASYDTEVPRRTILPAPISGDEVSLFALLRKNIGKDLSTISFPVTSNEPLGLLQRLSEDMEYSDLLSQACSANDPIERMCIVAAFAVSGFACTRLRSGRKPFTPMLGETFEDLRTQFIAEKVSNHPLIMACHAEGDGWEMWGTNAGKNHFWGKSLEIEHTGATHLRIGDEHYQWHKPSSFLRNLMVGTKYLEHVGSLSIENKTTGARCVIDFKEAGYWGTPNVLAGTVYSPKGKIETRLEGTWHEQLSQVLYESHLRVLWKAHPFPKHAPQYYGLTSFATTLNEITPDIEGKLPPTDTRYRPDLRALEEGNIPLAEREKARVEDAQRERRSRGAEVEPRWFRKVGPEEYVYQGGYWEQRAKGWAECQSLW